MLYSFLFLAGICCVAIVGMVAAIDVHYVALRVEDFRFVGLECVNVYFNVNVYDPVVGLDGKKITHQDLLIALMCYVRFV